MATGPLNPIHQVDERADNLRQPLSILDLLLATLIVALHLFHFPLAVRYRVSHMMFLVPLIPTLIAIWIHFRAKLSVLQATSVHYAVCVSWAFLYGYGYALAATQEPGSSYFVDPMSMGLFIARQMALIALFTTFLYGLAALCIKLEKQFRRKRP